MFACFHNIGLYVSKTRLIGKDMRVLINLVALLYRDGLTIHLFGVSKKARQDMNYSCLEHHGRVYSISLTHLPLDKKATISQTTFSKTFSWMKNVRISIQFSFKFVPKRPFNNKSALVQVMACRLFGAKPLPETMLTQFTDAYIRH